MDRSDEHHRACRALVQSTRERLVLPSPVIPEVDYFISVRLSPAVRTTLLDNINRGALQVENLQAFDYDRVQEVCETYEDANIGFVDAAVLAVVERLNEPKLATLDRRHFGMMRPRHVPSLALLP
jgi:predicted nucleic acid-binding protein